MRLALGEIPPQASPLPVSPLCEDFVSPNIRLGGQLPGEIQGVVQNRRGQQHRTFFADQRQQLCRLPTLKIRVAAAPIGRMSAADPSFCAQ